MNTTVPALTQQCAEEIIYVLQNALLYATCLPPVAKKKGERSGRLCGRNCKQQEETANKD